MRVWIDEGDYDNPYMSWNIAAKPYKFTPEFDIPQEDYERWESVKEAWEALQQELWEVKKNHLFEVPRPPRAPDGLPW